DFDCLLSKNNSQTKHQILEFAPESCRRNRHGKANLVFFLVMINLVNPRVLISRIQDFETAAEHVAIDLRESYAVKKNLDVIDFCH
ncbi:MAG: hypothetical protein P8M80_09885, partial [Pirellulaceae bacterium]|nr:hypothetical protein [Pirellulaceae bacterium]